MFAAVLELDHAGLADGSVAVRCGIVRLDCFRRDSSGISRRGLVVRACAFERRLLYGRRFVDRCAGGVTDSVSWARMDMPVRIVIAAWARVAFLVRLTLSVAGADFRYGWIFLVVIACVAYDIGISDVLPCVVSIEPTVDSGHFVKVNPSRLISGEIDSTSPRRVPLVVVP